MISCDCTRVPILYIIGEENCTDASFLTFVESAVACGWLKQGDFLALDNATIHIHSKCKILPDMLWETIGPNGNPLRINVLLMPTRSPELNLIELIFHTLVQRLKTECIKGQNTCRDAAAVFAAK
eukprot:2751394-Ditylum_brightwellii.AAC.1